MRMAACPATAGSSVKTLIAYGLIPYISMLSIPQLTRLSIMHRLNMLRHMSYCPAPKFCPTNAMQA